MDISVVIEVPPAVSEVSQLCRVPLVIFCSWSAPLLKAFISARRFPICRLYLLLLRWQSTPSFFLWYGWFFDVVIVWWLLLYISLSAKYFLSRCPWLSHLGSFAVGGDFLVGLFIVGVFSAREYVVMFLVCHGFCSAAFMYGLVTRASNLFCIPSRATYTFKNTYENNIQIMNKSVSRIITLNVTSPTETVVPRIGTVNVSGFWTSPYAEMPGAVPWIGRPVLCPGIGTLIW